MRFAGLSSLLFEVVGGAWRERVLWWGDGRRVLRMVLLGGLGWTRRVEVQALGAAVVCLLRVKNTGK